MNDAQELTMENLDAANREVAKKLGVKTRRMLQPVKDELRRQLEVAKAELALAELTYAKRLTLYMATMGLLGVIVGAVLAWGLK